MIRYLSLAEVIDLHERIIAKDWGRRWAPRRRRPRVCARSAASVLRWRGSYPDLVSKATALGFSLVMNHPFVDGNKRIGHAAMEAFLMLNGFEISAIVDSAEAEILALAAGERRREEFLRWVQEHVVPLK